MPELSTPAMQLGGAALGLVTWLLMWWLAGRMDRLIRATMRIGLLLLVAVPIAWILVGQLALRQQAGVPAPDAAKADKSDK